MKITYKTDIGQRKENQDRLIINGTNSNFSFLFIGDGHGNFGGDVAQKVADLFAAADIKPSEETILALFAEIHQKTRKETNGCTASCAWLAEDGLWLAQLGDSPIFVKTKEKTHGFMGHVVHEYAPDYKELKEKGVKIEGKYVWSRAGWSGLNMTRAFGDFEFGDIIGKIPEIWHIKNWECIAITSDGFSADKEEVSLLFSKGATAEDFFQNQQKVGVKDNFTAIVIYK